MCRCKCPFCCTEYPKSCPCVSYDESGRRANHVRPVHLLSTMLTSPMLLRSRLLESLPPVVPCQVGLKWFDGQSDCWRRYRLCFQNHHGIVTW